MRAVAIACLLSFVALAGCSQLSDLVGGEPDACIAPTEAVTIFTNGERFAEKLVTSFDTTFTMVLTGTIEGEPDTLTIAYDAANNAALLRGNDFDMRLKAGYYSIAEGLDGIYGRDLDPAATAKAFLVEFMAEDDLGVSFADDLTAADYEVTCGAANGVEIATFTYDVDGLRDVITFERNSPNRPLSGQTVDPALQDNFRVSISYDQPTIRVDDALDRIWLTVALDGLDYETVEDGWIGEYRIGDETEWAQLSEIDLAIVTEGGQILDTYEFQPGEWEIDEGYYDFTDADGNGLLSAGDLLEIGLLDGFDFTFWDNWAEETVDIIG